jgi:hypothetical protein
MVKSLSADLLHRVTCKPTLAFGRSKDESKGVAHQPVPPATPQMVGKKMVASDQTKVLRRARGAAKGKLDASHRKFLAFIKSSTGCFEHCRVTCAPVAPIRK